MVVVSMKAAVLLLVAFVHVIPSQARHTEFVYGPREHLDSGQKDSSAPLSKLHENVPEGRSYKAFVDYNYDDYYEDYETDDALAAPADEDFIYEEKAASSDCEESDCTGGSPANAESGETVWPSYDEEDDGSFVRSKRVKRRIIPVGGAIDRGRADHSPYERSRNPWDQPPTNRNREAVVRRTGPTGSAALFSLYPELAPPEWRAKKGIKSESKKANTQERDTEAIEKRSRKAERNGQKPAPENESPDPSSETPKRKSKISKEMKEEIAVFAEQHGVGRALQHFKSRVHVPLRARTIEKYLRRYQSRLQRKASRNGTER